MTKRFSNIRIAFRQRIYGSLDWRVEEPELIEDAIKKAGWWLDRELKEKGELTADHLDKACGILAEEIFDCMLNELDVPHVRTVPLLSKNHPVNWGKGYDLMIGGVTIDVKSISPLPPPSGHHRNLNANKGEIDHYGKSDLYVATKCYHPLPAEYRPKKEDRKVSKDWAFGILKKVKELKFLGYATAEEVIKKENLVIPKNPKYSPFYSLSPPIHSMREFAERFNINLKLRR